MKHVINNRKKQQCVDKKATDQKKCVDQNETYQKEKYVDYKQIKEE